MLIKMKRKKTQQKVQNAQELIKTQKNKNQKTQDMRKKSQEQAKTQKYQNKKHVGNAHEATRKEKQKI